MDETDENMSAEGENMQDNTSSVKVKPKKRSLFERQLETNLTALFTSPVTNGNTSSSSRYGRARRIKTESESNDAEKSLKQIKSPMFENSPVKVQSPVYKMHASNSPIKTESIETPKKIINADSSLENQIENIYHENIALSRFGSDEKKKSPGTKFPKVYVRKDLIQKREKEVDIVTIKNMFSPIQSPYKSTNSHLNNVLERSSEKYNLKTSKSHNGYLNTSSVVKTLDFDSNKKKKKENRDSKGVLSKSDLFEMEAKCEYQVGDLAWARMGTYPFWPCIVTREPSTEMFVKKKLFGRIERDVIHVTFFGDNGRRSWIVDTMLRKFLGQLEFEATRERFSPSAKKRDPKLYAAYFVSEKKMPQWSISVEEAETLFREPTRLRIDLLHDMLANYRTVKSASKGRKSGKITRTRSDVSLSESLYDTLFSEDDGKAEDPERFKTKTRNSLDMSEVVTACLDNMAAKTGITKIQRQSHMDRWLQKAKSKTPEKLQAKSTPQKKDKEVKVVSTKRKRVSQVPKQKLYRFRKSLCESQNLNPDLNEHDYVRKTTSTPKKSTPITEKDSLSGTGSSKDAETSQVNKDIDTTSSGILNNTVDSQDSVQKNTDISSIISADDSVPEIQVHICSVEEQAELESCLRSNQTVESMEIDLNKSTEKKKNVSAKESMEVDSEEYIDSLNSDNQKNTVNSKEKYSDTGSEHKESVNTNSDKEVELSLDIPNDSVNDLENKPITKKHTVAMDVETEDTSKLQLENAFIDSDKNDVSKTLVSAKLNSNSNENRLERQKGEKQTPIKKNRIVRHTRRNNIEPEIPKDNQPDKTQINSFQPAIKDSQKAEEVDTGNRIVDLKDGSDMPELKEQSTQKTNDNSLPNKKLCLRRHKMSTQISTDILNNSQTKSEIQDTTPLQSLAGDCPQNSVLPESNKLIDATVQDATKNEEIGNSDLKTLKEATEAPLDDEHIKKSHITPKTTMTLRLNRRIKLPYVNPVLQKKDALKKLSQSPKESPKGKRLKVEQIDSNEMNSNDDTSKLDRITEPVLHSADPQVNCDKPTLTVKPRLKRHSKIPKITFAAQIVQTKPKHQEVPIKSNKVEGKNEDSPIESEEAENVQVLNKIDTEQLDTKLTTPDNSPKITDTVSKDNNKFKKPSPKPRLKRNASIKRPKPIKDAVSKKPKTCKSVNEEKESIELTSERPIENSEVSNENKVGIDNSQNKEVVLENQNTHTADKPVFNVRLKRQTKCNKIDKTDFDEKMKSLQSALDESQKELCILLDSDSFENTQDSQEMITETEQVEPKEPIKTGTQKSSLKKSVDLVDDAKATIKKPRTKRQSKSPKISLDVEIKNKTKSPKISLNVEIKKKSKSPRISMDVGIKSNQTDTKKPKKSLRLKSKAMQKELEQADSDGKASTDVQAVPDIQSVPDIPAVADGQIVTDVQAESDLLTVPNVRVVVGVQEVLDVQEVSDVADFQAVPEVPAVPDVPVFPDEPAVPKEPVEPDELAVPDEPVVPDKPTVPDETAVSVETAVPYVPNIANHTSALADVNTVSVAVEKVVSDALVDFEKDATDTQVESQGEEESLHPVIEMEIDEVKFESEELSEKTNEPEEQTELVHIVLSDSLPETLLEIHIDESIDSAQVVSEPIENSLDIIGQEDMHEIQEQNNQDTLTSALPDTMTVEQEEEDMEYGHLEFTEKRCLVSEKHPKISGQIEQSETTQVELKENVSAQIEPEDKEYDHLDFIFSSCGSLLEKSTVIESENSIIQIFSSDAIVKNDETVNTKTLENPKLSDINEKPSENGSNVENVNIIEFEVINSKESEGVSAQLPVSGLPNSAYSNNVSDKVDQIIFLGDEIDGCIGSTSEPSVTAPVNALSENTNINAEAVTIYGDNYNDTDILEDDEDLEEALVFQDSFEKKSNAEDEDDLINQVQETDHDINASKNTVISNEAAKDFICNDNVGSLIHNDVSEDFCEGSVTSEEAKVPICDDTSANSKNEDASEEVGERFVAKKVIQSDALSKFGDCKNDCEYISTKVENETDQGTKILSELETCLENGINNSEASAKFDKGKNFNNTGMDIDDFVTSVNRLPEPVKLNGFHIDECLDFSDGEFNAETSSINSEDSDRPLSITKSKLQLKNRNKARKALADAEFVKYLELRQDELMDEHPELSQDEIVEYLYKTWQYEENAKSDIRKTDDIEQSGLVKGSSEDLRQKTIRNNFRESKKRNKKRDEDTLSISSDVSDTSVRKRLRTRATGSPALSEDNDDNFNKEMNLEIKTELIDNISINSDISYNSMKYTSPIDTKLTVTSTLEEKSISSISLNDQIGSKNISPDKVTDKSEESKTSKSSKRDKSKSPRSKEVPITNYFKVVSSEDTKNIDVNEENTDDIKIKVEYDPETTSINSEDSEVSLSKKKPRKHVDKNNKSMTDPEFLKYVELRQDSLIDENPQLSQDEIMVYLYKTWLYEESVKSDIKKTDDLEQASLVKGLNQGTPPSKKVRRKVKVERDCPLDDEVIPKDKPKRKISQPYYNEDLSDIEDEIELFEIFKPKKKLSLLSPDGHDIKTEPGLDQGVIEINEVDEVELYFTQLTQPKPNVFKGLVREKVCEICEKTENLVKCKGCNCMFHADCAKKAVEVVEEPIIPTRGRKKKKKPGRKPKNLEDSESHSDEKSQDVSEELNVSIEEEIVTCTVNEDEFEAVLAAKMQELLPADTNYDSYSSDDGLDWNSAPPGKCEIVDVKVKPKIVIDYSNFKCNNCQKYSTPICFVCKNAVSKTGVEARQKCQTAHCYKYYHVECLDHWPQTQFQSGEPSKSNKKISEHFETLTCPRHVCHTCVSDDPRGCKTRFSGDKLARCVRCPATYHTFTKCLPAGTKILTGSLIVCPRHYEHRPGKVPCHVNTGWCFICALGGSLICCEYCPTSFHAECLNIKPPEGGYMCEDCETGRLPLYGEMVWVKLGHYRWWPGIILHPCEIPENILAVKHSPGEFVVRFFGQYDHYWVNRGRVFPFQEGDSGKVSSQKSKIDAAFTTAMEHAQRACEILKSAEPNEEECIDIASSLLPPHYVKLRVNKPCGSLCGRRADAAESSLTQCECGPAEPEPCGPYSHCLNRMLLTECGPICRAGERCSNRAFEKRLYPKMVPYRTPHRGWGLKTLDNIKAGQFVIEYVGELIDEEEFRRRMNRKHEIRDENFYFLTLDKERMIDAGPKGNLARFMNHCCEPNCETQKWTVLGDVRVGLFALYDIPANSELTFNYNLECAGIEKKRCMCGAKRCSGYIGAKPKQEESQSKKNKMHVKRTYKKRKNIEDSPSTSKNKPKRPVGRPAKPRELTEIEKDLLIIKSATNGISSDSEGSGRLSIDSEKYPKALKRKRVSFSAEESSKKVKVDERRDVGD